jgi:hypothetical protein
MSNVLKYIQITFPSIPPIPMNHRKLIQLFAMMLPLGHEAIHVLNKLFVVISFQ